MTGQTRRDDDARTASATTRSTQVLHQLRACLQETAQVLTAEPRTERVGTAMVRLEEAAAALVSLLQERCGPDAGAGASPPAPPRELDLPVDEAASRRARTFCRAVLAEWAMAGPSTEAVVDVTSELVTNAARHATAAVALRLERTASARVVSVWDDGPGRPQLLPHRPGTSDRGIGLHWVEALTASWGWTDERGGKRVWAVVRLRA